MGLRVNVAQTSSITIGDSFAYPLRKCVRLLNSSGSHQAILAAELGLFIEGVTNSGSLDERVIVRSG